MKIQYILIFIVISTYGCSSTKRNYSAQQKIIENQINCSLELNKDSFQIGDELKLFFIIENLNNQPIYVSNSPYSGYYINGKRSEEGFDIRIKNESELELEKSILLDIRSGRFGITKIDPQDQLKIRIHDIFKYEITNTIGVFNIEIDKDFIVYTDKKKGKKSFENNSKDFNTKTSISKTETIKVVVIEK